MKLFYSLAAATLGTASLAIAKPVKAFHPGIDCNTYKRTNNQLYQQCKMSKFDHECAMKDVERKLSYHVASRKFYNVTPDRLELKPGMLEEYKAFMRERNSNRQVSITGKGWTYEGIDNCGNGKERKHRGELNDQAWIRHFSESRQIAQIYMNNQTQYNDNSTNYNGNVNYGVNNGSMQNNRYNGPVNNNVYQAPVRNSQCNFNSPSSNQNNFFGC